MNKVSVLETAQAIIDMANEIESLKIENKELSDRLIHAQSEALANIQNKPKPEPRDIGHENVIGFVTRKSGELQVSSGVVLGLIMDLIAKNPDHFGTDADSCPEPVEPVDDEPFEFKIGDRVRTKPHGVLGVVSDIDYNGMNGTRRVFIDTVSTQWFTDDSLYLVCRMY